MYGNKFDKVKEFSQSSFIVFSSSLNFNYVFEYRYEEQLYFNINNYTINKINK
jgi:hypothetical protein